MDWLLLNRGRGLLLNFWGRGFVWSWFGVFSFMGNWGMITVYFFSLNNWLFFGRCFLWFSSLFSLYLFFGGLLGRFGGCLLLLGCWFLSNLLLFLSFTLLWSWRGWSLLTDNFIFLMSSFSLCSSSTFSCYFFLENLHFSFVSLLFIVRHCVVLNLLVVIKSFPLFCHSLYMSLIKAVN